MGSQRVLVFGILMLKGIFGFEVTKIPHFVAPDAEIQAVVREMREQDVDRPAFCDYLLDYQNHYNGRDEDNAKEKLYSTVLAEALQKPSFAKLLALRPFFDPRTGVAEVQSPEKEAKVHDFYETVWSSAPFQLVIKFLTKQHHPWAKDEFTLKEAIREIWFGAYSRAMGQIDSSGFEHVFLGEEKDGEILGLHSWPVIHVLENDPTNKLDYRGFIVKRRDVVASANFKWGSLEKKTGSFLVSTSPAFDFCLFTLCFLTHRDQSKCSVTIDGCGVEVKSYELARNGRVFIRTIYPEAAKMTPECDAEYKKKFKCCEKFEKQKRGRKP